MPNRYLLSRVITAVPTGGRRVRVVFADGFAADLDLGPLADFLPIFAPLHDPALFGAFQVNHGALEWSDDLDLSPGTLRAWCEAGRVLTLQETDAWISDHSRETESVA